MLATWLVTCVGVAAAQDGDVAAARELLARGDAAAALQRLDAARGAMGGQASAHWRFLRGVALMDLGRDADALAWFEAMAQDHPELPDPWNNIALLHVRSGALDAARAALETSLRNDPSYRLARANLGLVHLMLAVRTWDELAGSGPVDALLLRRLEGARALLAAPVR